MITWQTVQHSALSRIYKTESFVSNLKEVYYQGPCFQRMLLKILASTVFNNSELYLSIRLFLVF